MLNKITTIKLHRETKIRLDNLRDYRRETYEELIQKILEILNILRNQPDYARKVLLSINKIKNKKK